MSVNNIVPVKMKKEDMSRPDVQAFRCGSKQHETPLSEWIRLHSADRIGCGVKVWLYRLGGVEGPLVGYGSLSNGKIREPDGSEVKVYQIPELAIHEDYWGQPKGASDPEEKYSRQIVRHLQREAMEVQKRGQREKILTLYVHPNAERAQALYEKCGFTYAPGRFLPDPDVPPEEAPGLFGMDYMWE